MQTLRASCRPRRESVIVKHWSGVLIVMLLGCSRDSRVATPPDADRRWMKVALDTVWTVGGNAKDTVLSYPARLTSVDDLVIVADAGNHRLIALRARDGSVAWINGRDEGRSFRRPLVLWGQPGRQVSVVDEETQILTTVDSAGQTVSDLPLVESRFINGACALPGMGTLVTSVDDRGPLYSLAADGRTATRVPVAGLAAAGHDPLVLQPHLHHSSDWATCVVATSFGGGLALWNGSTFLREASYREHSPFPVPRRRTQKRTTDSGSVEESFPVLPRGARQSAVDLAVVPGRIRVLFAGSSPNHDRIIDDYDDRTLEYLGSVLLPMRASEFATPAPDLVVLLTTQRGFPMIVALRQRSIAP